MNSRFGDTTYTKVFVGGLAWETQSHTLRRHFEQYGDILEAVVISDKNTGCSKGYGFVTFRDADSARRACAHPNPYIHGRRANCNLASLGRPPPPPVPSFASPGHRAASSDHPFPYAYQPAFFYPPHGYSMYGSDYVYSQGFYNPYVHQYVQLYGMPGAATVGPGLISRGQFSQPIPGYSTGPSSAMPAHQLIRFAGLSHRMPPTPSSQATDPSDASQAHITLSSNSSQFTSGSDQTAS